MRTKVKPNLDWLLDVDLTPDLKKAQATVTVKNVPAKRENTSRPVIPKGPPATMQELEAIGIKPIPALRNLYATKDGRVFSLKTGNPVELTQRINRYGYPAVTVKSKSFSARNASTSLFWRHLSDQSQRTWSAGI